MMGDGCGDKKLFQHLLAGLCRAEGENVLLLKQIDHLSGAHRNTSDKTF